MSQILGYEDFMNHIIDRYKGRLGIESATALAEEYMQGTFEKGLATTGVLAAGGTTQGDALKLQDVTKDIAVAELQAKDHATIWNNTKKVPCFSDAVEKTVIDSWGGFRGGGFINYAVASAGLSAADPAITRSYLPVRWQGGMYQVFRTALAVRGQMINADPITGAAANVSSTARLQQLILDTNHLVYHGDSTKNALESEGVIKQIRDAHDGRWECRINMKGKAITPDILPDIEEILRSKGGVWTDMYWSPQSFADMRKEMLNFIRTESGGKITMGTLTDEALILDLAGNKDVAKMHQDNFLNPMLWTTAAEGNTPPTKPSGVAVTTSGTNALNAWGSYLPAAVYNYHVKAVGVNGRSVPVAGDLTASPSGSQSVKLVITNDSGNNIGDVAYFEIWRGDGATGTPGYLDRIAANTVAGGATVTYYDNGEFEAGCTPSIVFSNRKIGMVGAEFIIRQLFPFTKVPLPNNVMSEQAAWLGAMTPQLLTPQLGLVIENIGRR